MDEHFPLKSQLRNDLVQSARSRNRRGRRVRLVAITMVLAVVFVAGFTGVTTVLRDNPATASVLSVVDEGQTVTVRLNDLQATPRDIIEELRSKRINVITQTVKVAPSGVGRFVSLQAPSADFSPVDINANAFTTFRVAKSLAEPVTVGLGVSAGPGEMYGAFVDAFLPGNQLHCSRLWGKRTSEIVAFSRDRGLVATYRAPNENGALTNVDPGAVSDYFVTDVIASGTNEIVVTLNREPRSPLIGSSGSGPRDCQ